MEKRIEKIADIPIFKETLEHLKDLVLGEDSMEKEGISMRVGTYEIDTQMLHIEITPCRHGLTYDDVVEDLCNIVNMYLKEKYANDKKRCSQSVFDQASVDLC